MQNPVLKIITIAWLAVFSAGVDAHDVPVCEGVIDSKDNSSMVVTTASPHDWIRDLGITVLRMDTSVTQSDFMYVGDLLETILPSMVEIVGMPVTLDTLSVALRPITGGRYYTYLNLIMMGGIYRDPYTGFDKKWDELFLHELTHAFQDDILQQGDYPEWISEGMAEAAQFIVGELATVQTGRDLRHKYVDHKIACYDLQDNAGEQVLGGCEPPIHRVDPILLYQNAAATVMIPAAAQIAAGFDRPHPIERLTQSLRIELDANPHQLYKAVDRAWPAPVDGSPPSRWLRSRSIACPSVRDGEFAVLLPIYPLTSVNPEQLWILHFTRSFFGFERHASSATLHYINAFGQRHTTHENPAWPYPPDLPEGAYLVEMESIGLENQPLFARTWIMIVSPPFLKTSLWEGVAVIFVNANGRPVNIPREQLTVNGRITARVPGGVIALTYDGNPGALTFRRNGDVIGTVTSTGDLPRVVVLSVGEPVRRPVVSWSPYRPVRDGEVKVFFVPAQSALKPETPGEVEVLLTGSDGAVRSQKIMSQSSLENGLLEATLAVPVDLEYGTLSFQKNGEKHRKCRGVTYPWYSSYELETCPPGADSGYILSVAFNGSGLVVTFDSPVDPSRLHLSTAAQVEGPWIPVASSPIEKDPCEFRWDISSAIGDGAYFKGWLTGMGGGEDEVLFIQYIASHPTAVVLTASLPFPNPSKGVVQWPFEVASPVEATFGVFDVIGRRVFSGGTWMLHPGVEVFRWDSSVYGERSPTGVYFLRVQSAGKTFSRKVILVR